MSLIKCHECAAQVSTEAKRCPQCGASVRKPMSPGRLLLILLVGFVAYRCTSTMNEIGDKNRAREAAMTPEQRAAAEKEKLAENKRFSLARSAIRSLKHGLKDPDSLNVETVLVEDSGNIVCIGYRAKNSFNAVVPGAYVFDGTQGTDRQDVVAKFCKNKKTRFISVPEAK